MERNESIHISTYDRPTLVDMNDYKGVFEPTTNRHQWSRWRIAVNDVLCKQEKRELDKQKKDNDSLKENKLASRELVTSSNDGQAFSKYLSEVPFKEFVRFTNATRTNALKMMTSAGVNKRDSLNTGQFIYFGIPRISLRRKESANLKSTRVKGSELINVYIPENNTLRKKQTGKIVRF